MARNRNIPKTVFDIARIFGVFNKTDKRTGHRLRQFDGGVLNKQGLYQSRNDMGQTTPDNINTKTSREGQNVADFLSHFKNGIATKNRYKVSFILPPGKPDSPLNSVQNEFNSKGSIDIKCNSLTCPSQTMMTSETIVNSPRFRTPFSVNYEPITFTFYSDSNLDVRKYFESWFDSIYNKKTNTVNFMNEYASDVTITVLNPLNEHVYEVILRKAWVLSIGQLEYAYGEFGTPQIINVTMAYKEWERL